jgi:tetratricopeptide (TPR) repeat protein
VGQASAQDGPPLPASILSWQKVHLAARACQFWLGYAQYYRQDPPALDAERDNVLQAIAAGQVYGMVWQAAADLALHFHPYMMYTGLWRPWERCLVHLLEVKGREGRPLAKALLLQAVAEVQARQGRSAEAVHWGEQAVALLRELGDPHLLARGLRDLAQIYFNLGRWEEVEALAHEVQALAKPEDEEGVLADAFILRGRVALGREQMAEAIQHFESALQVADRGRAKAAANFLGQVYLRQEQPDRALPHLWRALDIAQAEGDRPGQGVVLGNVGMAYLQRGRPDLALGYLEESLSLTRETDNRLVEAAILFRLGQIHLRLGQQELAMRYYEQALDIAHEVGDSTNFSDAQRCVAVMEQTVKTKIKHGADTTSCPTRLAKRWGYLQNSPDALPGSSGSQVSPPAVTSVAVVV